MKHTIANVLRNLAVTAVNVAERVDPQPPGIWDDMRDFDSFTLYGPDGKATGTWTSSSGPVKWHRTG